MDTKQIRQDFPILETKIGSNPLIYFDNAATTQLPLPVLECYKDHFFSQNANIHRGAHFLSNLSTDAYEKARADVALFLGTKEAESIVFTSGTTASVNMTARLLEPLIDEGDAIVVTDLEHHSNYLPWVELCKRKHARFVEVKHSDGEIEPDQFAKSLPENVKIAAFAHVTNTTGTVLPIRKLAETAHKKGAFVFVDGAQALRHEEISLEETDIDFYAFSGHKIMAPPGTGALYIRPGLMEQLEPSSFGGGMVDTVTASEPYPQISWNHGAERFEAGTPNYPGAIALAKAIEYLEQIGRKNIAEYEAALLQMLEAGLNEIEEVTVIGHPGSRAGVISLVCQDSHPYDLARILDAKGIAVRAGQMCAQPCLASYGIPSFLRISPAFYNSESEVEQFLKALKMALEFMKKIKK